MHLYVTVVSPGIIEIGERVHWMLYVFQWGLEPLDGVLASSHTEYTDTTRYTE